MSPSFLAAFATKIGLDLPLAKAQENPVVPRSEPPWRSGGSRGLTVLLVVEPGLDGVFRHVEGLLDFLLKRGIRVHLAYSSRRSGRAMLQLVARVQAAGGQVLDMRVTNIPQPADSRAFVRLAGMVSRLQPDVVHAHSSKAGGLARLVAVLCRCPVYIYTPHAYYGLAKPPWLRVRFFNALERVLGRLGKTIAISQDEANFACNTLRIASSRVSVIHNPVDTARFHPPTPVERQEARAKLGIPANAIVLATIGRMCWQKDPETAYHAVAPICTETPRVIFLHLGWGKWKSYLLEKARKLGFGSQLRIQDYVDDPRDFYHALDGVVISSRYEAGWPLVFLEALACNLPVIASTCPGMSDIDKAGLSHVWTFSPENVQQCTQAVRLWLENHLRTPTTPCNHRQFAIDQLAPERCYGAVFDLYCTSTNGIAHPPGAVTTAMQSLATDADK